MLRTKSVTAWVIILAFAMFNLGTVFAATPNDIVGHWAEKELGKWYNKGIIIGDPSGNVRPNSPVTRAELATILGRVFGYIDASPNTFKDVVAGMWYENAILKANANGVIFGSNGFMRPGDTVSREEAAVMMGRAFELEAMSANEYSSFADATAISEWAREYVSALKENKYMQGKPGNVFEPKAKLTRAEMITIINNGLDSLVNAEGTYSSNVEGNLVVNTPNVTLKDMTINGNLYLAHGIGEGEVAIDNVVINGRVYVNGGGENSIVFNNSFVKVSAESSDLFVRKAFSSVISIKKDDIIKSSNFKTSDVLLSDAFRGLEVTEIENLPDSINISVSGSLSVDHVYYEDHLNGQLKGTIGLKDAGSKTTYHASLLLTGPELSVGPNAVAAGGQDKYDFVITNENGVFAKAITSSDIELRGSFQSMKIDTIVTLNDKNLSIKLSGTPNTYSSGIIHFMEGFDLSGSSADVLVKLIPDAILYSSGILYHEHDFAEDIIIRLKNHEFSKQISPTDITLSGGLSQAMVTKIEVLDPRSARLSLTGLLDANSRTGTVTVAVRATNCGQAVSVALPIRDNVMFYEPKALAASLGDEIKTYALTLTSLADFPTEIKTTDITLGGVLQKMKVTAVNSLDSERLTLELLGPCGSGTGSVSIGGKGLYDISIYVEHPVLQQISNSGPVKFLNNPVVPLGSVSVGGSNLSDGTRFVNLAASESLFDYKKILGGAATGLASFAGGAAASYILNAAGIYKGTDAVLAEINQRIKDLQASLDASTLKITKDVDECNIKVQTAVIKDYISSYITCKNKYLSMTETTSKAYKEELANKMEALDVMKVLNHINMLLTDETDSTRNLIHTYNDYMTKVFPFRHQIDQPLKEIVQYYALIQTDMLYYYGIHCNYKYATTGDETYLNDFQSTVDTVTANIKTQMDFVPNNPLKIETDNNRKFFYPVTNNDGKSWCIWDPVNSSDWFQYDTHIDEPSLLQLLTRNYWHYTWTCSLIGKGYRVPTTDDITHIKTDFFKDTALNTGTFLLNNGIVLSGGYHKIYLETCDLMFAEYYYFLDGNNMAYDYHKMGSASKLTDIWLVVYISR